MPTPAEIEAAATSMMESMFAPHELPVSEDLQNKYRMTAKAALAAAKAVREEPRGCPTPGACSCVPPKEEAAASSQDAQK